jgi:hypothetical protein
MRIQACLDKIAYFPKIGKPTDREIERQVKKNDQKQEHSEAEGDLI